MQLHLCVVDPVNHEDIPERQDWTASELTRIIAPDWAGLAANLSWQPGEGLFGIRGARANRRPIGLSLESQGIVELLILGRLGVTDDVPARLGGVEVGFGIEAGGCFSQTLLCVKECLFGCEVCCVCILVHDCVVLLVGLKGPRVPPVNPQPTPPHQNDEGMAVKIWGEKVLGAKKSGLKNFLSWVRGCGVGVLGMGSESKDRGSVDPFASKDAFRVKVMDAVPDLANADLVIGSLLARSRLGGFMGSAVGMGLKGFWPIQAGLQALESARLMGSSKRMDEAAAEQQKRTGFEVVRDLAWNPARVAAGQGRLLEQEDKKWIESQNTPEIREMVDRLNAETAERQAREMEEKKVELEKQADHAKAEDLPLRWNEYWKLWK